MKYALRLLQNRTNYYLTYSTESGQKIAMFYNKDKIDRRIKYGDIIPILFTTKLIARLAMKRHKYHQKYDGTFTIVLWENVSD